MEFWINLSIRLRFVKIHLPYSLAVDSWGSINNLNIMILFKKIIIKKCEKVKIIKMKTNLNFFYTLLHIWAINKTHTLDLTQTHSTSRMVGPTM